MLNKKIGTHYMINNGLTEVAANAVELIVDNDTGVAYACYLSSENELGESTALVKIARFNILQPTNVTWAIIFDKNKDFNGDKLLECNLVEINKTTIRVYCVNKVSWKYYFKDVDKVTLKTGELKELKFKANESAPVLNYDYQTINNEYLLKIGKKPFTELQITSPIVKVDGVYYTTSCGGDNKDCTLFLHSLDGEVWTIKSVIDGGSNYEAMLCYNGGRFWVMKRRGEEAPTKIKKNHLVYSYDGLTWHTSNLKFCASETRPYLFNYQGDLYLAYSSPLKTNFSTVRPWRCNIHVGKIVSKNGKERFKKEIYKESKFGIVYYALTDWYGKMIMLYSSGEVNPTKGKIFGFTSGKDCINYTILKEKTPILKFEE